MFPAIIAKPISMRQRNNISCFNLLILLILFSCSGNKEKQSESKQESIDVAKAFENKQELKLSQFATEVSYIKLETNPDCLIAMVGNLRLGKRYLVLSNGFQGKIFLFTRTGKFIKTIGSMGKGPGEYISISGLVVDDQEKYIFLTDNRQKRLIRYGLADGSAISVNLNNVLNIYGLVLVDSDVFVYVIPDMEKANPCSIIKFDQSLNITKSYMKIDDPIERIANMFGFIKYYKEQFWLSNPVLNSLDIYDSQFQLQKRITLLNRQNNEEFFDLAFSQNGLFVKLVGNILEDRKSTGEITKIYSVNLSGGILYLEQDQVPVYPLNPISQSNSIVDDLCGLNGFSRPGLCSEKGYFIHHLDINFLKEKIEKYRKDESRELDNIDPVLVSIIDKSGNEDNPIIRVIQSK